MSRLIRIVGLISIVMALAAACKTMPSNSASYPQSYEHRSRAYSAVLPEPSR